MSEKRCVILSGPSGVGKGPLVASLNRFHPEIRYEQIPVIKSKESRPQGPRPEETPFFDNPDYFLETNEILHLADDPQYLVGYCRGLPQAIDINKIQNTRDNLLFVELYHTIGAKLVKSKHLTGVNVVSIFLSPLGRQEIQDLKSSGVNIGQYLCQIMLHKQLVRGRYLENIDLEDALYSSRDSFSELPSACIYSHVIVNHDGEGSPNWNRLPGGEFIARPEGDAGRSLSALEQIIKNSAAVNAETWNDFNLYGPTQ